MLGHPSGIVAAPEQAVLALKLGTPQTWWMFGEQLLDEPRVACSNLSVRKVLARSTVWRMKFPSSSTKFEFGKQSARANGVM